MISTGNDIIALNSIDISRTRQERFYSKILSPGEIEQYAAGDISNLSFENYVWLLWSVKESVYKFCKRDFPQLGFSPRKIIIQSLRAPSVNYSLSFGTGEIEAGNLLNEEYVQCTITAGTGTYYSRSKIYNEIIHTVVNNRDNFDDVCCGIKYIDSAQPARQSQDVRLFILKKLKTIYPGAALCIAKHLAGYPVLKVDEKEMNIPISFTHQDRFVAYALVMIP